VPTPARSAAPRTKGIVIRPRLLLTAVAVVIAAASTACGTAGAAAPSSNMSMTIGYTAVGAAYDDLYVCEDKGVFKKNGLDVTLTLLNSSSQLFPAIASNSVQIGAGEARSTAAGALAGFGLSYIALPIPRYYLEMWGSPSITSPDQLKGKRIGLSSPGSLGDASVDALLRDKGWSENDVQKTFLKSTSAEVTALQTGAVDVIVTQPPTGTKTRALGFHKVMDFTRYPSAANAYVTTTDFLKSHPAAVEAFVKSEVECLAILHTDKATAIASIRKHSGSSDPKLAEYAYDFFEPLWARVPTVDPALAQAAFDDAAAERHDPPPADISPYLDNTMVEDLQRSGFIDSLYKKP
jgi:NitT/TauT family transport system substrate-binding protein